MSAPRRWLRWGVRGLAFVAFASVVLVLVLLIALDTPWGRARARDALLAQVDAAIPGRLEVGALERLGPRGVTLREIRLLDPTAAVVLELDRLSVAFEPLSLLRGRIILPEVVLERVRVDLRGLDEPGRGLLAALVDPAAPPAPPGPGPPPYVRVDRIVVSDAEVQAPELGPPWRALRVSRLDATARLELDRAPEVALTSLSCELERGGRPLARVSRLEALLARPGDPSALSLALELGAVRASLSARGVLPPAPEMATAPLSAELRLAGVTAHDLGDLLEDPSLTEAFAGAVALDLSGSGTLDRLSVHAELDTAAGRVDLRGSLRERRMLDLQVATAGLVLSRLRPDLPSAPLTIALDAATDRSDPMQLPLTLRAAPGQLGPFALPRLDARAIWNGQRLRDLSITLDQGQSRIALRGSVDAAGSFDVHVGADVSPSELGALATAAGLATRPRAALKADLRVQRALDGVLGIRGDARAEGVRLPGVSLDAARVEVDLAGHPLALAGRADIQVRGLVRGATRVPRADLVLDAGRGEYRVRGDADVDRSHLELDVRARPEPDHWQLRGTARGHLEQTPFVMRLGRTAISPAGWIETQGIDIDASEQQLHVAGSVGRPRSELVVSAPSLELGALARLASMGDDWRGRAALELRLSGRLEAPALVLTLDARDLARGDAPALSVRLDARLDAEQGRASVDLALGSGSPSSWVDASLALAAEFAGGAGWQQRLLDARQRARLELGQLELGQLERWLGRPIPVSARLGLAASLEGTLRQPVVHVEAHAALAAALGLPPLRVDHRLDYEAGKLSASLDVADPSGRWLSLGTELGLAPADADDLFSLLSRVRTLGDVARWNLHFVAERRRLGTQWTDAPDVLAALQLDTRLDLEHEVGLEPTGSASVHVSEARLPNSPAGCAESSADVALDATLSRGKLDVTLSAAQGRTQLLAATATAALELVPALRGGATSLGVIASELSSRGLDLEKVPFLCGRVRGRLDARVSLADPLGAQPLLEAQVSAAGLSLGAEPSLGIELTARADRTTADAAMKIAGPRGVSSLSARLPVQWSAGRLSVIAAAPLVASARLVALPIAPLLDPAGAVSYATGWLSGSVDVGGTVAEPEPRGVLELADAELTATALAQPLHGVRGRVSFDRRALAIERFEARDRDGELSLSGRVERRTADAIDMTLDVRAEQFPLRQRGQIVATTSGHAKIHAAMEPGRTSVAVRLLDADTWLEKALPRTGIDLAAHPDFVIAMAAPAKLPGGSDSIGSETKVRVGNEQASESHVRIDASDRFWIKRDDFAIQLSTRLDAVIVGDQAKVTGKVDINRGYFDLMGRVFDVMRGSRLEFIGASTPDPVVDISASYEHRGSGKTVKVQISGRGSKPVLTFYVDDVEVSAGEVLELVLGGRGSGGEASAKKEATSFVSALTAGLLATSARRELGAAAPIIMIEPGDQTGDGRIRAGFELDALVPAVLRPLITGVYVEGIVERAGSTNAQGQSQQASTQAGVLLELYFPYQLFSTGQWGPGTTWSLDWGWQL